MLKNKSITAVVITHNEELNLKNCLESIKWVNEIIIVDSFSTDKTLLISKKYTNKIYSYKFSNDFSQTRNFALSKASGDWILVLDADESISKYSEFIIHKLVVDNIFDGYWFPRRNYINENKYLKHGYFYPDLQLRLFRNNKKIIYSGRIHEQPLIDKKRTKEVTEIEIFHNNSHTKYNSIFSFYRFVPYIKIEAKYKSMEKSSIVLSLFFAFTDIPNHSYKSFIILKGYKDGIYGLRAALLHSFYIASVSFYAIFLRLTKKYNEFKI